MVHMLSPVYNMEGLICSDPNLSGYSGACLQWLGGEWQLVAEPLYQARIDGRDDLSTHIRMFHKRGFMID